MVAWVRKEGKAPENWHRKGEVEEVDKVKVTPGVTEGSLRRFSAALIRPTQGLPKWRRFRRYGSLGTLRVRCCRFYALGANTRC